MQIHDFQKLIERIYFEKDSKRGMEGTYMWFAEEVGELTRALRRGHQEELAGEFADVLAWLASLASIAGIDLQAAAMQKYQKGVPALRVGTLRLLMRDKVRVPTTCAKGWIDERRTL